MFHVKQNGARETIFALATAPAKAGVAVVRVSGPDAGCAVAALCRQSLEHRMMTFVTLRAPDTGRVLDRCLAVYFTGPQSFTGEDVLELHLHGSLAVISDVLGALATLPNFRGAEAGEFTRRAFDNGKLDLTSVEALADLIAAETEKQKDLALRQGDGALMALFDSWGERLLTALSHEEAAIDFAEEDDIAHLHEDTTARRIVDLATEIDEMTRQAWRGERLRDGFRVAVVGPPNAGKSSLVNALVRRDVSIVSRIPGTTRDVVEGQIDLGGYAVTFADTAGLRATDDEVELEGIRRAHSWVERADCVITVSDGRGPESGHGPQDEDVRPWLHVRTHSDLVSPSDRGPGLWTSVRTGEGLAELEAALLEAIQGENPALESPVPSRARQVSLLRETSALLRQAAQLPAGEVRAELLRQASASLGRLTGRTYVSDVLDQIFSEFCIGK
ncbi:tRNA uridine-5-carboxymethylaminomethyl(34) synthesis GTPase MnmE [Phaeovibrio sulfidiphilus]|uniref:tRNA modification GTPase MnmE n=1 Tax=Phaeovibrio sulfidiphilus TaxID=1220600 RepID=A0A8J7CD24_9PROT|nr:tRNA uridine-5-carboxymethylaminomethyl(34) synthesis GTPase MnmE [Phaeovibrio sulfidiphilus]MBE1236589.1 tRNA uridine-5-carboxymethylaminomethyl(34) synthesis GTPase MnmE [Phaeovibrio sulfidiphilus]